MRSIDIIIDRAGFYETWGCLVWVPSVYTLHTRAAVGIPSGLGWVGATFIFVIGLAGVGLNFWADHQRQMFRESEGKMKVWGKKAEFIEATYTAKNAETNKMETHKSLLLASGWWGLARHLQYSFELTAAWSWGLLGGGTHSLLPLFYPAFLTVLLVHRASRDQEKCLAKYGDDYKKYMQLVPYKIIPYLY
uniref:7-dehydrocholesterol reductase n=2 Tax=Chrysotila carterae TaxID=13221 RepID=A0A7S4BI37_CHRCT